MRDPGSPSRLDRGLSRFVAALGRFRWPVVGLWLVLLAVAGVVGAPLPTLLSGGGWNVPGSESDAVNLALQHGFVGRGASDITVVVHDRWYTAAQPGFEKRAERVITEVASDPDLHVTSRLGYASTTGEVRQGFVGHDGATSIELLGLVSTTAGPASSCRTCRPTSRRRMRAGARRVAGGLGVVLGRGQRPQRVRSRPRRDADPAADPARAGRHLRRVRRRPDVAVGRASRRSSAASRC